VMSGCHWIPHKHAAGTGVHHALASTVFLP
jgi:hypothetical protein